jgi:hypothetical protein
MLGGTGLGVPQNPTSIKAFADPVGAPEDPTAGAKQLVLDEAYGDADFLESFAACIKEAVRRGDCARFHSYFAEIVKCGSALRSADERLTALEKLGGRQ